MDGKEQVVTNILNKMRVHINQEQLMILNKILLSELKDIDLKRQGGQLITCDESAKRLLSYFLVSKQVVGCTESTINSYAYRLGQFILELRRPLTETTTDDIRYFLIKYKENRRVENKTLENSRLALSSFFSWLHNEGYISKNPMSRIGRIKEEYKIRRPFSEEDLEKMRMCCKNERDFAIIEFLYSSGIRVGELVKLNKEQIDFAKQECVVFGKGRKERIVYLNSKATIRLKSYLDSRVDDNPALFVWLRRPYARLTERGVETFIRELGRRANIEGRAYPHRFRRTMATNALNRGMPLQEVRELMGHSKADTTLIYNTTNQDSVKMSHKKYIA